MNSPAHADRRSFLATGLGSIALTSLAAGESAPSHRAAKAKNVIFLFMSGGPSHLETFEPKPELKRLAGQPLPESFGDVFTRRKVSKNRLFAPLTKFTKHGESGLDVSEWLPHTAGCADDLCVLRGCYGDSVTHPQSVYLLNTGSTRMGRPSLGSWVTYGLGSENNNMPAYVVMPDPDGWVKGGAPAWGNGFLPAAYQGTLMSGGETPIPHLKSPLGVGAAQQRKTLDLVNKLNRLHADRREANSELSAKISAYELAFRMQSHAPEVVDISSESAATKRLYGLDDKATAEFGLRCLLARRMVERGVRFVQLYCGGTNGWDAHSDLEKNHTHLCRRSDKPTAALLKDLKARGLLEETLVIWGGEFGRTPMTEGKSGRDHNPYGFTMWLAGGGVKAGQTIGGTDDVGLRAEHGRAHVHDVQATVLHLLGMDHLRLTYRHNGRDERLTENGGKLIDAAVA